MKLPPVYPITDRTLAGLSHADQVRLLAQAGAELIQLREKRLRSRDFLSEACEAVAAARETGIRIIVNDRVDIAMLCGADGVHLGQTDLSPEAARKLMGPDAVIGYSTHDTEQIAAAVNMPIDYVAFGPVFPTETKQDPDPVTGLEKLREAKKLAGTLPLVAIGGISFKNIADTWSHGADAGAVISALWSSGDARAEFQRMSQRRPR